MNRKTALAAVAVLAASTFAGFAAQANPIYLGYSIDGGGTIVQLPGSGTDGSASVSAFTGVPGFSISLQGIGAPTLSQGSLNSSTLTVSTTTGGTIRLYVSETGNTGSIQSFTTGFANNSTSTASVIESTYATSGNVIFGTGSLLSTATVAPGTAAPSSTVGAPGGLSNVFTVTDMFTLTLPAAPTTGPRPQVSATLNLAATPTPIPEPATLALLGAGLVGLGMVRRRQKA